MQPAYLLSPEAVSGGQAGAGEHGRIRIHHIPTEPLIPRTDRQSLRTYWVWEGDRHGRGGGGEEGTPESWARMPAPRSRGTGSSTLTHTTQATAPEVRERSEFQNVPRARRRLQTAGTGDAQSPVPLESWGQDGGDRPGGQPCPRVPAQGSEQQAQPVVFLPLRFLQRAEGDLGGLSEHVLHVLPKLGGAFQVERGLHLLRGGHALAGRAQHDLRGLERVPPVPPVGLGLALGAVWQQGPWCGASPQRV